jgi:hypothetical protein
MIQGLHRDRKAAWSEGSAVPVLGRGRKCNYLCGSHAVGTGGFGAGHGGPAGFRGLSM